MISSLCPICNKTGSEPGQNGLCDCVKKLFDHYDFKGIAEAFAKGDLDWHQEEWREFITMIEQKAVKREHIRLFGEIEKMRREMCGCEEDGGLGYHTKECSMFPFGFNQALEECVKIIKDIK